MPPSELGVRVGMMTSSIFAAVFNRYRLEDAIGFDAVFGLVDQVSFLTFSASSRVLASRFSRTSCGIPRVDKGSRGSTAARAAVMLIHGVLIMLAFAAAIT